MNKIQNFYKNYHLISQLFFDNNDSIDFVSIFLENNRFKNIADVGCGYGFISNNIKEKTIGFDISKELLNEAKKNNNGNHYILSDFHKIINNYNNLFDLTLCLRSSWGNSENDFDNINYLKNLKNITKKNGKIILDIGNPNKLIESFQPIIIKKNNHYKLIRESKIKNNYIYQKWIFKKHNNIISESNLGIRIYSDKEIDLILKNLDLKIVEIYGDYNFSAYKKNSQRKIMELIT